LAWADAAAGLENRRSADDIFPDPANMRPADGATAPWFALIVGQRAQRGAPRQSFGRSRAFGGKTIHWIVFLTTFHFTTKVHLRVNGAGLPMRSEIAPGQISDYLGFDPVMADNQPEPSVPLADRGHDSDNVRKAMEAHNVVPVIPMRKTRKCAWRWIAPSTGCATSSSAAATSRGTPAASQPAMARPPKASWTSST
jgi:hypothetical protein